MKRFARSSGVLVGLIVLVAVGAVGVYYVTLPSTPQISTTGATHLSSTASVVGVGSTANNAGYLDASGQPQGAWANYLGYIPSGYQAAPKSAYSATWPCPTGMSPSDCKVFQTTCGNGVCDPNERCDTCPLDCGVTGALTCDPYTGRAGAPAAVCQIQVQQEAQAAVHG